MNQNIAVAHNHFPAQGGGERVANKLAEQFDARLVTAWIDGGEPTDEVPVHELIDGIPHESFVRKRIMPNPTLRNYFYKWLWENAPPLRDADVIIQSGGFPSYYVEEDDQQIIRYIHSPPRYPFDRFGDTTDPIEDKVWRRPIKTKGLVLDRFSKRLSRRWNRRRMVGGGVWIANSEVVKRRIHLYYGVPLDEITVIYPPVDVGGYTATADHDDYYLVLSRLVPAKRIGEVIEAFHDLNRGGTERQLIIAGDGYHRDELEETADGAEYIDFEGYVSEKRKLQLYQRARATIMNAENEDFGIVPIESMAAGTPVLGVEEGFTEYQIKDGENGRLYDRGVEELASTVVQFERHGVGWSAERIHRYAQQFSADRFEREMRDVVEEAQEAFEITPEIPEPSTEVVEND